MKTEDVNVAVAASGWGQLYEQNKRVSPSYIISVPPNNV